MPRPIQAHIHTAALQHNLQRVQSAVPDANVWAVVKANAYGHGIERVFEGLRGADGFALLDLAEAERVRALGWRGPSLLHEGVFAPRGPARQKKTTWSLRANTKIKRNINKLVKQRPPTYNQH